jgi:hypothetical protein
MACAPSEGRPALARLSRQLHVPETDMFRTKQQLLDEAYDMQGRRIAYVETDISATEADPR